MLAAFSDDGEDVDVGVWDPEASGSISPMYLLNPFRMMDFSVSEPSQLGVNSHGEFKVHYLPFQKYMAAIQKVQRQNIMTSAHAYSRGDAAVGNRIE